MTIDLVELSKDLIRCPSVTPNEAGAIGILEEKLRGIGFNCRRLPFAEEGVPSVENLYARIGSESPHFCFAGHTDVVPPGDNKDWISPPFEPEVREKLLFGRGAADMKCAIAAMVSAAEKFLKSENKKLQGSISFLITGDEEGPAINGTSKVLEWMKKSGEVIDACIVGEPTNPENLGEMIKIGRRGSMNIELRVDGIQGHSAYPHLADNPIHRLVNMMTGLIATPLDGGSEFFQPSDIQVTTFDVGNLATNVIPARAEARCNVRFNDLHSSDSLIKIIRDRLDATGAAYNLDVRVSGESFLTKPGLLSTITSESVKALTGIEPVLSTTGGTSDARFIKEHCPVVEFGLCNETAHKANECARIDDIFALAEIYENILVRYFSEKS